MVCRVPCVTRCCDCQLPAMCSPLGQHIRVRDSWLQANSLLSRRMKQGIPHSPEESTGGALVNLNTPHSSTRHCVRTTMSAYTTMSASLPVLPAFCDELSVAWPQDGRSQHERLQTAPAAFPSDGENPDVTMCCLKHWRGRTGLRKCRKTRCSFRCTHTRSGCILARAAGPVLLTVAMGSQQKSGIVLYTSLLPCRTTSTFTGKEHGWVRRREGTGQDRPAGAQNPTSPQAQVSTSPSETRTQDWYISVCTGQHSNKTASIDILPGPSYTPPGGAWGAFWRPQGALQPC